MSEKATQCPPDWLVSVTWLTLGLDARLDGEGFKEMSGSEPTKGRVRKIKGNWKNKPLEQWHSNKVYWAIGQAGIKFVVDIYEQQKNDLH